MANFRSAWERHYPDCPPIGFMMPVGETEHWVRFHSLPGSRRTAENNSERRMLLGRQNRLADDVLGDGNACWLVQSCWEHPDGEQDISNPSDPFWACREYDLSFAFHFFDSDDDEAEEGVGWNVHAGLTQWRSGGFDTLLLAIADWQIAPTLWMSTSTGAVFAPYDGGVDLFLPDLTIVERLRRTHSDWLSPHPLGL